MASIYRGLRGDLLCTSFADPTGLWGVAQLDSSSHPCSRRQGRGGDARRAGRVRAAACEITVLYNCIPCAWRDLPENEYTTAETESETRERERASREEKKESAAT